jgi:ABC-2 type transport system ATP-binding protein
VPAGTVYGLIGRNGAGKTTLLRILMGLLPPDSGTARVLGANLWTAPRDLRARVTYVPQTQQLHSWMTCEELCRYVAHFYTRWDPDHASLLARRFELPSHTQVGVMSGGEQRKVSILLALAARPDVLILDEPAAGLDPIARRELIDQLVDVICSDNGCTVLFSTHIISDLERIAEHVGIMDRGSLVTSARLEELQSRTKRVQVIFEAPAPPPDFTIPGTLRSETAGPVVTAVVRVEREEDLEALRRTPGTRVNVFPLGLEDIFISLFGPETRREFSEEAL